MRKRKGPLSESEIQTKVTKLETVTRLLSIVVLMQSASLIWLSIQVDGIIENIGNVIRSIDSIIEDDKIMVKSIGAIIDCLRRICQFLGAGEGEILCSYTKP